MHSRIVVTAGEGAGIGPELCYYLATCTWPQQLVVIADKAMLQARLELCAQAPTRRKDYGTLALTLRDYDPADRSPAPVGTLIVLDVKAAQPPQPGRLDARNAPYVLNCLKRAHQGLMQDEFAALVTGPISKEIIDSPTLHFTGHTEYLQQLCGVKRVVMLLGCPQMKVALATTHLPLKEVSSALTPELLYEVITILHHDLEEKFGIVKPLICVAGLNPHAGENGHLGTEELTTIIPTLQQLRAAGYNVQGPLPADTMFSPQNLKQAAAFLCMYHDQGLPVLKFANFASGYNTTLGLPYIRTSVDHGTALSLAGSGAADPTSLICAVKLAADMADKRQRYAAAHAGE